MWFTFAGISVPIVERFFFKFCLGKTLILTMTIDIGCRVQFGYIASRFDYIVNIQTCSSSSNGRKEYWNESEEPIRIILWKKNKIIRTTFESNLFVTTIWRRIGIANTTDIAYSANCLSLPNPSKQTNRQQQQLWSYAETQRQNISICIVEELPGELPYTYIEKLYRLSRTIARAASSPTIYIYIYTHPIDSPPTYTVGQTISQRRAMTIGRLYIYIYTRGERREKCGALLSPRLWIPLRAHLYGVVSFLSISFLSFFFLYCHWCWYTCFALRLFLFGSWFLRWSSLCLWRSLWFAKIFFCRREWDCFVVYWLAYTCTCDYKRMYKGQLKIQISRRDIAVGKADKPRHILVDLRVMQL